MTLHPQDRFPASSAQLESYAERSSLEGEPMTVERCRALLRKGGYPEHQLSDDDVRSLRSTMLALVQFTETLPPDR